MKGFPNQVAELPKLAIAMRCLVEIEEAGNHGKNDGVFGEALVRSGVAGTGHIPMPIEDYLEAQLEKKPSDRSYRTTARGLRELFRLMGFIDDSGPEIVITELGRRAATFAGGPLDQPQVEFWRRVINNIVHTDANGTTHPYQVMLGLIARRPGIPRAKCALAFEARNDSPAELNRIAELADLSEEAILEEIGITKPNWDNAKKVLPRFAEQLGDVIRTKGAYALAVAPGQAAAGPADAAKARKTPAGPRAPRTARAVTPETIGNAGLAEYSDEVDLPPTDPAAIKAALRKRADRLRRHNLLLREFAKHFADAGAKLSEESFDALALFEDCAILVEVKTLDGTGPDERDRVRDALGQLLYYERFLTPALAGEVPIRKVACFESRITDNHRQLLNALKIAAIWKESDKFVADKLAHQFLDRHLKKLG